MDKWALLIIADYAEAGGGLPLAFRLRVILDFRPRDGGVVSAGSVQRASRVSRPSKESLRVVLFAEQYILRSIRSCQRKYAYSQTQVTGLPSDEHQV
jgi:hypothetical protein